MCPKSARLKGEFRESACSMDSGSLGSAGISAVLSRERRKILFRNQFQLYDLNRILNR